jgi:hypothetical protein
VTSAAVTPHVLHHSPGRSPAREWPNEAQACISPTKVHSLLLDAVEAWCKNRGLREPVRADCAAAIGGPKDERRPGTPGRQHGLSDPGRGGPVKIGVADNVST